MKRLSELSEAERRRLCSFNFAGGPIDDIGEAEIAFAALGVAAMAWARLETHIEAVLVQVNKRRFSQELHDPEHPVFFSRKLRLLKTWFNKHKALAKFRPKIKPVAERAKALSAVRNELLHALFESYDPDGQKIVSKKGDFILCRMRRRLVMHARPVVGLRSIDDTPQGGHHRSNWPCRMQEWSSP
jgi:hypothetical protein